MKLLDDLDVLILSYIAYKNISFKLGVEKTNTVSTTEIAKVLYPGLKNYDLRSKDNLIRHRLKKWAKLGLFKTKKNKKGFTRFILDEEKIRLGAGVLQIIAPNGENQTIDLGTVLGVKVNGRWIVKEIPETVPRLKK